MHIEVLVEDSSGKALLSHVLPKIIGPQSEPHTYRIIAYRGVGHIPKGLTGKADVQKRILLDRLPKLLRGYANTPGVDAVVVVLDVDKRDCVALLADLEALALRAGAPKTVFRLAIEEVEAWYLGDRAALLAAYPNAKLKILNSYEQDSACGTWEFLADALHPGGSAACKVSGGIRPGDLKHEWAATIGPHLDVEHNRSPSFKKLRAGLNRLVASEA